MTTNAIAVRPKQPLNPLRIVASALFIVFGILSAVSAVTMVGLHWTNFQALSAAQEYSPELGGLVLFEFFSLVTSIAAPVLAIAIGLIGLFLRKRWLQPILGGVLFAVVFLASWVWQIFIVQSEALAAFELTWAFQWTQSNESVISGDTFVGWAGLVAILLAFAVSAVAPLIAPKIAAPAVQELLEVAPTKTQTSQAQAQASVSTSQSNLTNLPMFALIGAFIIPLAGIILGHLSLSYMKKGQLSEENKGMAKAGLILGYGFVGFTFLVGLVFVIALISASVVGY
jgi:hypothetical protein